MTDAPQKLAPEATSFAQDRLAKLQELAEINLCMARRIDRQAERVVEVQCARVAGDKRPTDPGKPGEPPSNAAGQGPSRCVRLTLALQFKFEDERDKKAAADLNAQRLAVLQQPAAKPYRPSARRQDVERAVRMQIERQSQERDYEDLFADMKERLFEADYPPFATKPVSELVSRICNDLKVAVDWALFDEENWARHEMLTRPGRSYYTPPERRPPKPPGRRQSDG